MKGSETERDWNWTTKNLGGSSMECGGSRAESPQAGTRRRNYLLDLHLTANCFVWFIPKETDFTPYKLGFIAHGLG